MTRVPEDEESVTGPDAAAAWCIRLETGGRLSPDEEAALQSWLQSDHDGEADLTSCLDVWDALGDYSDVPEMIAFRADALNQMRRANRHWWQGRIHPPRFAHAVVASAMAILLVLGTWYVTHSVPENLATGTGERRAVMLADGSRVSLDARSQVTVALSGGQRRLVLDEGRAKFDVSHDSNRPFTVQVGKHIVVATGTSFSTELLNGKLHVILYDGRVVIVDGKMPDPRTLLSLRNDPKNRAIVLKPGDEFVGDANRAGGVVQTNPPRSLSWEHGVLDFTDEPLSDAVAQLNRYSDDVITVRMGKAAAIRINGVFDAGKSRPFLEAISDVYPVTITRRGEHQFDITM